MVQAAAGLAHTAVLDASGAVYTLGWNQDGQLGLAQQWRDDRVSRNSPTLVGGLLEHEDVVQVRAPRTSLQRAGGLPACCRAG